MPASVDLNCDMGESYGRHKLGYDEDVIKYITSANIACGFHAGDPAVIRATVVLAGENGVGIGAHPSLPDMQGFGRRRMELSPTEIHDMVIYQVGALKTFAEAYGYRLQHVKPHGALSHMSVEDRAVAAAIAESVWKVDRKLILLGVAGTSLYDAAVERGLPAASEYFADRNYTPEGTLVPRSSPQAMVEDEDLALERAIRVVKTGEVEAVDGSIIKMKVDSICLHGDALTAVAFARLIREGLQKEGVSIKPLAHFIQ